MSSRLKVLVLTAVLMASACSATPPSSRAPSQPPASVAQQSATVAQQSAPAVSVAPAETPGTAEESPAVPDAPQQFKDFVANVKPADKNYEGTTVTVVVDSIQTGEPFFWLAPAIEKAYGIKLK